MLGSFKNAYYIILMKSPIYTFKAVSLQSQEIDMSSYAGKILLIVNTASKCGFTPQYEGLESLYKKYRDQGLEILGFPCNQFGNQEPGDGKEIKEKCLINYGVSFPVFKKVKVNGPDAHPLFSYLTSALPGWFGRNIKWNFTKFLLDRDGNPVHRFAPVTTPEKLEPAIQKLLKEY